jgi:hypothetical protein
MFSRFSLCGFYGSGRSFPMLFLAFSQGTGYFNYV